MILIDLSFIRTKVYSGVAKYAYRILDYIVASGKTEQYTLLTDVVSHDYIIKKYPQFKTIIIGNKRIAKIPIVRTFWLQHEFKRIVDSSNFDVVFCPWANQITCLKSNKIIVSVIHDLQSLLDWKGLAKLRDKLIFDAVIKNSTRIVTISEFSKNQILSLYPTVHVDNLSNSVSMEVNNLPERIISKPYVLYVGRLDKMKNIITLVKAFSNISERFDRIMLVLVGKSNAYWNKEILPLIKEMSLEKRIILREDISEKQLSALYRDAELFVFPSMREGFGSPPVEASIMGIPVVSSKADSLEEVSLGLWYTYNNPLDDVELSNIMTKVLSDPPTKERLSYIRERMLAKYSTSIIGNAVCDYLERCRKIQ